MSEDSGGLSNSDDDEPPEEIGENLPASINGDDVELQEVICENLPASINGDDEELQEVICENLPASFNGDDEELQEVISENPPASINGDNVELQEVIGENLPASINREEQHLVEDEEQQGQRLRTVSPESPAGRYCCYAVIIAVNILPVAVTALSLSRSEAGKTEQVSCNNTNAVCPKKWIGVGNTCFYFSEDEENWTSSQKYCIALEAQLARFDNHEELNFLKRYKGPFDHWIGLHRESSQHPWMWTDNTEYNNLIPIRGEGNYAYLSDRGISSGRDYIPRKWICSKPNSYTLQCPGVSQFV